MPNKKKRKIAWYKIPLPTKRELDKRIGECLMPNKQGKKRVKKKAWHLRPLPTKKQLDSAIRAMRKKESKNLSSGEYDFLEIEDRLRTLKLKKEA